MQINSDYILIDNKRYLELCLLNLSKSECISIDTESSGYYTYFPRVCLLQITSNGKNYIIDTLAPIDLPKLSPIFLDPKILKIFHSATDDIKALKRDFHFEFCNIVDTMYSSKMLGMAHNSLNYLVEHFHDIKLSKVEQKSNWEKRPLDKHQLKYAALDTAYLESIWTKMKEELQKRGLLEEVISECDRFAKEPYIKKDDQSHSHWYKFPSILKYDPEQRRMIHDILQYRETKAKKSNRAAFRIINTQNIESIVKDKPDLNHLIKVFGKKEGTDIYNIVQNPSGEPIEKSDIPKEDYGLSDIEEHLYIKMRKWREIIMKKRKIDHTMVLPNKYLALIAKNRPTTLDMLRQLNIMSDWKINHYGPSIIRILQNESYDGLLSGLIEIRKTGERKASNGN